MSTSLPAAAATGTEQEKEVGIALSVESEEELMTVAFQHGKWGSSSTCTTLPTSGTTTTAISLAEGKWGYYGMGRLTWYG